MQASLRPCTWPGCGILATSGRCERHRHSAAKEFDRTRGNSHQRGYGRRWQAASEAFLRSHPLCQCPECDEGRIRARPASVVDHKVPHRGDMKIFWDSTNWQSMAKPCHDRKTAREDGGFGNRRAAA